MNGVWIIGGYGWIISTQAERFKFFDFQKRGGLEIHGSLSGSTILPGWIEV